MKTWKKNLIRSVISIPLPRLGDRKHNLLYKNHKPARTMTNPLFIYPFWQSYVVITHHFLLIIGYYDVDFVCVVDIPISGYHVKWLRRKVYRRQVYRFVYNNIYHMMFFIVLWYKDISLHFVISLHVYDRCLNVVTVFCRHKSSRY